MTARVRTSEGRRETIEKHLNLTQAQLDEAMRVWKEIIERTNGQLTAEDVADIEREFDMLQERLKWMDEVFQ